MKFLSDMGISPKTVIFLQSLGYDAVHLHEQGLERLPDSAILEKARNEKRILLTHDLGFGELLAAVGDKLPSVITFRLRNMQPIRVNLYLHTVITRYKDVIEQGAIVSITEGQIRVRQLPFNTI